MQNGWRSGHVFFSGLVLLALGLMPVSAAQAEKASPKLPMAKANPALAKSANVYDHDYVGSMKTYVATYEDTMVQIARTMNVGFVELRSANPFLDPWVPGAGKTLVIPTMHMLPNTVREGVVINLAEMRMYAFLKPGQAPGTFPLGIGREGLLTPSGTTAILRKKEGPVWRPTARMRKEHPELPVEVPPGPDNPMGTHAMYLGWPEYAIHGTDKPFSIGRRVSSGCIRMYPEDIEKAYKMFPIGTKVTVVDQPVKVGWVDDALYLEAHPTASQADKMELDGGLPGYVFTEEDMGLIVAAAGENVRDLNWALIRQVVRERRGYPVEIFKRGQRSENPAKQKESAGTELPGENTETKAVVKTVENRAEPKTQPVSATPN